MNNNKHWNVCVNLCTVLCGRGGRRPSVKLVSVVLAGVYIAYCTCSDENNGMEAFKMATWVSVDNTAKKKKKKCLNVCCQNSFYIWCKMEPNEIKCWMVSIKVTGEGTILQVFESSRLKIKTGRARFRETGKVMQGNGLRHQPAHHSLC